MGEHDDEKRWRVSTSPGGGYVSWRPGYGLPFRWTTRIDRDDLPYEVQLDFTTTEAGPECRSARFLAREGGEPIGTRQMRKVPLRECIEVAITSAAAREEREPGLVSYAIGGTDVSEPARLARAPGRLDDHLREVAAVYLSADSKPTQAVQERWPYYSYSTVARWVMQARRAGLLPPAKQKKES